MTCEHCRETLAAWLQSRWDGSVRPLSAEILDHASRCPGCAGRLAAAQRLAAGAASRPLPPQGLAQRIVSRVLDEAPVRQAASGRERWVRPAVRWGLLPVAAALVAAVGTAAIFGAFAPRGPAGVAGAGTVVVRFVLEAPQASQVSLVGDWNDWDPQAQPLRDSDQDGVWEIQVPLRRGQEHQYQFLIDGSLWMPDPSAPLQVYDGLGGVNSVLQI